MRFGLNQGRKLVHFSSPGWMWPLATLLLLQLCVTLWGESRAESLNLDIIIFPMKFSKTALDDELSFCSIGCTVVVCGWGCRLKGGGERMPLDGYHG